MKEKLKAEFEVVEFTDRDAEKVVGGGIPDETGGADTLNIAMTDMRAIALGLKGTDGSTLSVASSPHES